MNDVLMKQTTEKVIAILENIGITATSDLVVRPINKTLRGSWYVNKLHELGYKDCTYINLSSNGFLVVLNDCSIASGENIMIRTAFENIAIELNEDNELWYEFIWDNPHWKLYNEDEEDGLIICTNFATFVSYLDELTEL